MKVRGSESSRFGVKMLQPVTQYQQTTRAVKYGMLIIVLVFLAGFVALAYAASYVMMQMETYAMLGGSLLLFACLCGVMYCTRNGFGSVEK